MHQKYSPIPIMELYPVVSGWYFISGKPFLYHKESETIVIGDIHLGQESSMFWSENPAVSISCKLLVRAILESRERFKISRIVLNGDIKHSTKSIKLQELEELRFFTNKLIETGIDIIFVEGNHDPMLEFIFSHIDLNEIQIHQSYQIDQVLIHHGHRNIDTETVSSMILSHEHPAFTFYGTNRARVKLPAFVTLQAKNVDIIILPAANSISTGTNFPIKHKREFLSPFLQQYGNLETMEIFPFDDKFGLFELPPVSQWSKD